WWEAAPRCAADRRSLGRSVASLPPSLAPVCIGALLSWIGNSRWPSSHLRPYRRRSAVGPKRCDKRKQKYLCGLGHKLGISACQGACARPIVLHVSATRTGTPERRARTGPGRSKPFRSHRKTRHGLRREVEAATAGERTRTR